MNESPSLLSRPAHIESMTVVIDPPPGWTADAVAGVFITSQLGTNEPVPVLVRVFEAADPNPDYLLARFGTTSTGRFGRPQVQSLPAQIADGVSVVRFEEDDDQFLRARIDLVRRAWNLDIVVSARTTEIDAVELLFPSMLDLLASIRPSGEDS